MDVRRKREIVIFILTIVLIVSFVSSSKALHVSVNHKLNDNPVQGHKTNFTLFISDLPKEGNLSLDTDLLTYNNKSLYSITSSNLKRKIDKKYAKIPITGERELKIRVIGRIPNITITKKCSLPGHYELTLKKHKDTTGIYYRVKVYVNGVLRDSKTETFNIKVPWAVKFDEKLKKVKDKEIKSFIEGLYNKGLVTEANDSLDYILSKRKELEDNLKKVDDKNIRILLKEELNNKGIFAVANRSINYINPEATPLYYIIAITIIIAFITFIIGARIGAKKGGGE